MKVSRALLAGVTGRGRRFQGLGKNLVDYFGETRIALIARVKLDQPRSAFLIQ